MSHQNTKTIESESHVPTRLDLALYLLAGTGLYFLSLYLTIVILLLAGEWTAPHSFMIYLLNAIGLVGAVYALGIRRGKITWSRIGIVPKLWRWRWLLIGALVWAVSFPARVALADWIGKRLPWDPFGMTARGLFPNAVMLGGNRSFSWGKFGLILFGGGVLIPIAEELYFRGLIHSWFQSRLGPGLRIFLSSLIFGLWHLPAVGTAAAGVIFGLIVAVAYERSRSIWLPIALHMLNNIFLIAGLYLSLMLVELSS
jgi:membrane protease YdiL (CAAX protease family)